MKIDKKNALHWFYLIQFGINVLLALLIRCLPTNGERKTTILYGHKLNGNLKGIYDYCESQDDDSHDVYFLTMDPAYFETLQNTGFKVLLSSKLSSAVVLARANAIVSDHGLHVLSILLKFSDIKFFDVWHSIPFKGFDADDFRVQHRYHEVWVTSRLLTSLYVDRFGFDRQRLHETGYARTDVLINKNVSVSTVKASIGIKAQDKKVIMFAPTWIQDDKNRNIFPFNMSEDEFLALVDGLCEKLSIICIFRTHLNTPQTNTGLHTNIVFAPHSDYPNTEELLLAVDILVGDWSSIAFDYILLDRPTIFIESPSPFAKGFSLDETYRFGHIVKDMEGLIASIAKYISRPEDYLDEYGEYSERIKKALYDENADGLASQRCVQRLHNYNQEKISKELGANR